MNKSAWFIYFIIWIYTTIILFRFYRICHLVSDPNYSNSEAEKWNSKRNPTNDKQKVWLDRGMNITKLVFSKDLQYTTLSSENTKTPWIRRMFFSWVVSLPKFPLSCEWIHICDLKLCQHEEAHQRPRELQISFVTRTIILFIRYFSD